MSARQCQVVFTGVLREGFNRRKGIGLLAKTFGLEFSQIKKLLASHSPVIKRCDHVAEGEKLVQALWHCGWIGEILQREAEEENAGSPVSVQDEGQKSGFELTAEDGACSISVPHFWQAFDDLNQRAVLQAGSLEYNEFLVVLPQKVNEFPSQPVVAEYCRAQLSQCAEQLVQAGITAPPKSLEIGGYAGFSGQITAEVDTLPVRYQVVCVGCDDRIYTLFLWCEQRAFEQRKRVFDEVIASFSVKLVESAGSPKSVRKGMLSEGGAVAHPRAALA